MSLHGTLRASTTVRLTDLLARLISHSFRLRAAAFVLACAALLCGVSLAIDAERMRATVAGYGSDAVKRYTAWRQLIGQGRALDEAEKLARVNDFFNRNQRFSDDIDVWNVTDYWASPIEFLGKGAGDCEDFAIAKYFSLQELGVPVSKLRLTYVRAVIGGANSRVSVEHMVLTYYPSADAEPLVLDNLINEIRPASARKDLYPVVSFNGQGVWAAGSAKPAPIDRLTRWTTLRIKMQSEGYDP